MAISAELADVLHLIADHLGSHQVHEKINSIASDPPEDDDNQGNENA